MTQNFYNRFRRKTPDKLTCLSVCPEFFSGTGCRAYFRGYFIEPSIGGSNVRDHSISMYAEFSEKLTFLTHSYADLRVRIRGLEILVFRKSLCTY